MSRYTTDVDSPPVWAPIERFASLCRVDPSLADLAPADFMYMACMRAPGRPPIHLYKHIDSRRYLNLDAAGHAYRYVHAERDDGHAWYAPLPDLRAAVRRVLLTDQRGPGRITGARVDAAPGAGSLRG